MSARRQPSRSRVPFGAVYLLEPEYAWDEIARDLDAMVGLGFDLVTLWPVANSWRAKDPAEWVFDDTRRFLDLCEDRGLRVILQLIGQNPAEEYAPDCLLRAEHFIDPLPGSLWVNLNHPHVRELARRFLAACVRELRDHPAVFGWDVFNEAHFRSTDPHTTVRYREWLRQRYGDIAELNRRWRRRFRAFEEIDPREHRASYSVWSSQLPRVEYEMFHAENLTALCREWATLVKQIDPSRPVMVDGTSGQLLYDDLSERNNDEFGTAATADIFGGTFYPKSWGRNLADRPWDLMLYYGIPRGAARQAGKPYFINELQTHTQSLLTPGSEVSPAELRLYVWGALAAGGEAMQLWRWRPFLRGYQNTGRGLTALDGTPGPRAFEMGRVVEDLRRLEFALAGARPVAPDFTLLLGYRSRVFYDAFLRWGPSNHPDEVRGWHRALLATGATVEVASLDRIDALPPQSGVLVLPAAISLSEAQVRHLAAYVAAGGCLVADARLNALNEWEQARREGSPGTTLAEVFGVQETDVGGPASYDWQGLKCAASFLTQQLAVRAGADVLARDERGWPMVVTNRFGRGRTVYFASVQGIAWHQELPSGLPAVLHSLFSEVAPHRTEKPETTIVRWHENDVAEFTYVLNFSREPAAVSFAGRTGAVGDELLAGGDPVKGALTVPAESVRLVRWAKAVGAEDRA